MAPTLATCAIALAATLTMTLGACAAPPHHGMRGGTASGPAAMCATHEQMTAGKSAPEQRAAVEAHVRSMHGSVSPGMVEHHLRMMQVHCRATRAQ